jgi:hypothetical protein
MKSRIAWAGFALVLGSLLAGCDSGGGVTVRAAASISGESGTFSMAEESTFKDGASTFSDTQSAEFSATKE